MRGQKAARQIPESKILQGLLNTWTSPQVAEVPEPLAGIALGRLVACPRFPYALPRHLLSPLGRGWQGLAAQDGCFLFLQTAELF